MKRNYSLAAIALLLSLFIYLFYRTEKTVATEIFIRLVSPATFHEWKNSLTHLLPLNEYSIYSLPEGLWVFAVTITSKPFFIKAGRLPFPLIYWPIFFAVGLEFLQLLHISKGHFDPRDIAFSFIAWAVAGYGTGEQAPRQPLFKPFTIHGLICIATFLLVYLAHVWD